MRIKKFTKNILFDEKMGDTLHIAVRLVLTDSGVTNKNAIHIDMIRNMKEDAGVRFDLQGRSSLGNDAGLNASSCSTGRGFSPGLCEEKLLLQRTHNNASKMNLIKPSFPKNDDQICS